MAQLVKYLPWQPKDLILNPSTHIESVIQTLGRRQEDTQALWPANLWANQLVQVPVRDPAPKINWDNTQGQPLASTLRYHKHVYM